MFSNFAIVIGFNNFATNNYEDRDVLESFRLF